MVSGTGSNLQALLDATADELAPAEIVAVVSNRAGVVALQRASDAGVPAVHVGPHPDEARDDYEEAFRSVIREGAGDGSFAPDADPKTGSIFILSILNAVERWYRPDGRLDREALVAELSDFARSALRASSTLRRRWPWTTRP